MHPKLLKVNTFSLISVISSSSLKYFGISGSMIISTALEINLIPPPYCSSFMFSMESLLIFCTKFANSSLILYSTLIGGLFSKMIKDKWISFSSQRMHSMELDYFLALNFLTTDQIYNSRCSSSTFLSSISWKDLFSMEIIYRIYSLD